MASVAVAVIVLAPSVSAGRGAAPGAGAVAVVVQIVIGAVETVTVVLVGAVPLIVGVLSLVTAPAAGVVMTGAAGAERVDREATAVDAALTLVAASVARGRDRVRAVAECRRCVAVNAPPASCGGRADQVEPPRDA